MTQKKLKQAVNDHLGEQSLSDAQWQALDALQQNASQPQKKRWRGALSMAASLLIGFLIAYNVNWQQHDTAWEIADEAAMNHLLQRPLEVSGSELDDLRGYFRELQFSLLQPNRLQGQALALAGGRYCSVKGVTAAQLRLLDRQGNPSTLYQVPYDPQRFDEIPQLNDPGAPLTVQVRGLEVDLWVEMGLLFAQVRQQAESTGQIGPKSRD